MGSPPPPLLDRWFPLANRHTANISHLKCISFIPCALRPQRPLSALHPSEFLQQSCAYLLSLPPPSCFRWAASSWTPPVPATVTFTQGSFQEFLHLTPQQHLPRDCPFLLAPSCSLAVGTLSSPAFLFPGCFFSLAFAGLTLRTHLHPLGP